MEDRAGKARWLSVSHAEKRCRLGGRHDEDAGLESH